MTLEEAKNKALRLLDEEDGDDELIEKIVGFLDTAQKRLAMKKPVVAVVTLARVSGQTEYAMPADMMTLRRIWVGGKISRGLRFKGKKLVVPASETRTIEIEYAKVPATVDTATADNYVFEIAEDAAQCMPFFAAAQCLSADLVQDSNTLLAMYQMMVDDLPTGEPGENRIRNVYA